ncbi:MAG: enoyl-CoA hydratase-related protein [Desulfurococcales archaeon]|nr:enoyl-CoA hydratase-related protein [Desulfurococcales archaeon]
MTGIRFEERDGVLLAILSRPDKLNALDTETLRRLSEKLAGESASPKVLLLAAEGRVFSAGIDLEEVAAAGSPEEAARPFKALGEAIKSLLTYPAPTISYVHAPAIAGGAELALATDIIVVGPRARFEWPEVKWNIVAPLLLALASRSGIGRLAASALTGESITAEEAIGLGIASYRAETLDEAIAIAGKIAGLYRENHAAFTNMLPALRQWKFEAVNEVVPQLESLAKSMELVERARRFVSGRR